MNLEKNELTIHRRADDFEDPRSIQPNEKTNARILHVDQELASALHTYVVKYRQAVSGATEALSTTELHQHAESETVPVGYRQTN